MMRYYEIPRGSTSQMIEVPIFDSSSSVGALLTGLVYNSSGLSAYYDRQNAAGAATAISLVNMTKGTWTSGGFVAVDATNMPGVYQLGLPDAALADAAGVNFVTVHLKGAANMVPVVIVIRLTNWVAATTPANTLDVSATGEAGLDFSNVKNASSGTQLSTILAADQAVNVTKVDGVALATHASGLIGADVRDVAGAAVSTSSAQLGVNVVNWKGSAAAAMTGDAYARLGAPVGASISADIAALLDSGVQKNTALSGFTFFMADSSDHVSGKTGLTVTAQRSLDGAAFGACANSVSEIGSGWYKIDLAAADLNGNVVALKFTATGADPTGFTIKTSS